MESIWKYPLDIQDNISIMVPEGAKSLCIKTQNNIPCLWMIVNTSSAKLEELKLKIYGTGHNHDFILGEYIDTFLINNDSLVFHVFEVQS